MSTSILFLFRLFLLLKTFFLSFFEETVKMSKRMRTALPYTMQFHLMYSSSTCWTGQSGKLSSNISTHSFKLQLTYTRAFFFVPFLLLYVMECTVLEINRRWIEYCVGRIYYLFVLLTLKGRKGEIVGLDGSGDHQSLLR